MPKKSSLFRFLMEHEGLTFPEAVRSLARDRGIPVPEFPSRIQVVDPVVAVVVVDAGVGGQRHALVGRGVAPHEGAAARRDDAVAVGHAAVEHRRVLALAGATGGSYLQVVPLLMFGEAFLNGMLMILLVAYKPGWVATFHDHWYLDGK